MSVQKPQLLKNIILSATIIISLVIVNIGMILVGSQLGFSPKTLYYDVIMVLLNLVIALFSLILFGSIVEYAGKEPGIITIIVAYSVPALLAYYSELLRDNMHIAITLLLYLGILAYILLAR